MVSFHKWSISAPYKLHFGHDENRFRFLEDAITGYQNLSHLLPSFELALFYKILWVCAEEMSPILKVGKGVSNSIYWMEI